MTDLLAMLEKYSREYLSTFPVHALTALPQDRIEDGVHHEGPGELQFLADSRHKDADGTFYSFGERLARVGLFQQFGVYQGLQPIVESVLENVEESRLVGKSSVESTHRQTRAVEHAGYGKRVHTPFADLLLGCIQEPLEGLPTSFLTRNAICGPALLHGHQYIVAGLSPPPFETKSIDVGGGRPRLTSWYVILSPERGPP
jgi:hypothetical protein